MLAISEVEEGQENQFAIDQRAAFDAQQMDPETAIDIVESGVTIMEPPADCQMSTFDARDALQTFSNDLSNILTYKSWLEGEFAKGCDKIRGEMDAEAETRMSELEAKEEIMMASLEDLFKLLGNEDEKIADFAMRIRKEYDMDDMASKEESDIVVPEVPDSCSEETKASQKALQDIKDETDDCLSYQLWLDAKLAGECDALTASFEDIMANPPHAMMMAQVKDSGDTDALIEELFKL